MSAVTSPGMRTMECANRASPIVAGISYTSVPLPPPADARPENFPEADAYWINEVMAGKYGFRNELIFRGIPAAADETSENEEPRPFGTRPCPEGCSSIHIWGISENVSEEELRSSCSEFGHVAGVKLFKATADGDLGGASVTFEKRLEAQRAQSALHRTLLDEKEIRVGWEGDKDVWESSSHHWMYVWIPKGTTGQDLYRGFRRAGAPCTDAHVVRMSSPEETEGVGAVAFRDLPEYRAVSRVLPHSRKTNWSKLNRRVRAS